MTKSTESSSHLTARDHSLLKKYGEETKQYSSQAEEYAKRFIEEWEARIPQKAADVKDDDLRKACEQEDEKVPQAYMIPISNAFNRQDFKAVAKMTGTYMEVVPKLPIPEKAKLEYMSQVYWMNFLAIMKQTSPKPPTPITDVEKSLRAAMDIQPQLEKFDKEGKFEIQEIGRAHV